MAPVATVQDGSERGLVEKQKHDGNGYKSSRQEMDATAGDGA